MAVWIFELEGKDCSFSVLEHLVDGWEENWFREQNAATSVLCHVKGFCGLVGENTKVVYSSVERQQSRRGLCLLPDQDDIQLSVKDLEEGTNMRASLLSSGLKCLQYTAIIDSQNYWRTVSFFMCFAGVIMLRFTVTGQCTLRIPRVRVRVWIGSWLHVLTLLLYIYHLWVISQIFNNCNFAGDLHMWNGLHRPDRTSVLVNVNCSHLKTLHLGQSPSIVFLSGCSLHIGLRVPKEIIVWLCIILAFQVDLSSIGKTWENWLKNQL